MTLNFQGMQTLMEHLEHNEMRAIYLMGLGKEMPLSVTKVHLTKIIRIVCTLMNWTEDEDIYVGDCKAHLSKGTSDLKQKCTQLATPFWSTVFHAFSHGVFCFVRSVRSRNHFLIG